MTAPYLAKGEGRRKSGIVFDDDSIKAFSQWKWKWNLSIEIDVETNEIAPKTITITITINHEVNRYKTLFELEDIVFELQTGVVIEEGGKFIERRWRAMVTSSPV